MSHFISGFIQFIESYGMIGLMVLSFAESSFFPIPPDLLLIPMAVVNHSMAIPYSLITTVFSVLGGILGYGIGKKFGKPLLMRFVSSKKIDRINNYFSNYGGWAIVIAGLTPIPYKLFTLSAGMFNVRFSTFILASLVGRGLRFIAEGLLIFYLGDIAQSFLSQYFELITIGLSVVLIAIYALLKLTHFDKRKVYMKLSDMFNKVFRMAIYYNERFKKVNLLLYSIITMIMIGLLILFVIHEIREDYFRF